MKHLGAARHVVVRAGPAFGDARVVRYPTSSEAGQAPSSLLSAIRLAYGGQSHREKGPRHQSAEPPERSEAATARRVARNNQQRTTAPATVPRTPGTDPIVPSSQATNPQSRPSEAKRRLRETQKTPQATNAQSRPSEAKRRLRGKLRETISREQERPPEGAVLERLREK